jgi:hypothetical protein
MLSLGSGGALLGQIVERLRSAEVETQSVFDRRALPAYLAVLIGSSLTVGFVAFGGFRFVDPLMIAPPTWCASLIVAGLLARRYGHSRTGGACESIGLIYAQGIMIEACCPMLTAYSLPYADWWLVRADQLLGFDWVGFIMLFRDSPLALKAFGWAYMSFLWQAAAILISLFATGRDERAWRFVTAAGVALLITVAIYPLAPAVAGYTHFGITPEMYPNLNTSAPWAFVPAIESMKSGTKIITSNLMTGYVTIPSYHASSALLFSWAVWPFRSARWPFALLNLAMCAAAIIIASHYLIDLLAGAAVAILAIAISNQLIRRLQCA